MDIFKKNEKILSVWEKQSELNGETDEFVPDGIMYRGEIQNCDGGCEHLPSKGFIKESEIWETAPMRFLFITKELNCYGGDAWEIRKEVGGRPDKDSDRVRYPFHWNLVYPLYGLGHIKPDSKIKWNDPAFTNEVALDFYDTCALARINVKKQVGGSTTNDSVLVDYMEKYKTFLQEQILNLDADIIVCCGYKQSIERTGNLILNFLMDNCYPDLKKFNNWIYYSKSKNIIAINSWHLSARGISGETFYTDMTEAYSEFLQNHRDFVKAHR